MEVALTHKRIFEPPCSSRHIDPAVVNFFTTLNLACVMCHEKGINSSDRIALENWIVKGK